MTYRIAGPILARCACPTSSTVLHTAALALMYAVPLAGGAVLLALARRNWEAAGEPVQAVAA
jgi:hypothetical protein